MTALQQFSVESGLHTPLFHLTGRFPLQQGFQRARSISLKNYSVRVSALIAFITIFMVAYYNARSLFPKIDRLHALVTANMPDTVCIVESWLDNSISDSEITLPGYIIVCLDQNCHGGGILMYFKTTLHAVKNYCIWTTWPLAITGCCDY